MRSNLIKLTICSLLFLLGSSAAYACSCNYPDVNERLKSSDIVFLGHVLDIAPLPVKDKRKDEWWGVEAIASLKVEKQYKGIKISKIKVYWMRDIFGPGDCGELPLVRGEKYLIFSDRKIKGRFIVHQDCSWSSFAKDSKEDIKILDLPK